MSVRRIEFLETLGKGGFGAVFLADVHGRDDFVQRLAVKVLSAELGLRPDIAARQRDEARLLARLHHDHIVRVVDLTEVEGRPAVLMEYVEGADAGQLLRAGPIPPRAAVQIAQATASALEAAWGTPGRNGQPLRVIHRDIKPANVLVSRHGGVKVLDFGVARADFDREGVTGSVQFGTARYMAPEQWLHGETSPKVDVYALGVTLVELLTSLVVERPPLARAAFDAHVDAIRAAVIRPDWPPAFAQGVDELLAQMLAFEPADRPDAAGCSARLVDLVEVAPGESLRRWAPGAVPPCIEARRRRWAAEPAALPPGPGAAPAVVPVAPTATVPVPAPSPSGTAPAAPPPDPTPSSTTLALPAPAPRPRRTALVAVATLGAVLALGLALWGLAAPEPATAPTATPTSPRAPDPSTPLDGTGPTPPPGPGPGGSTAAPPAATSAATSAAASPAATSAAASPAAASPAAASPAAASAATSAAAASAPSSPGSSAAAPPAGPGGAPADTAPGLPTVAVIEAGPPAASPEAGAAPPAAEVVVSISSKPWGARVQVDGRQVGVTPLRALPLPVGAHELRLELDGQVGTHRITAGGRNPTQYTWTVETDTWHSSL